MATVHLESLRLAGFKSFPDEVSVTFPGRVSAIIGPNGCGKSNLVDALLWVLGEQSASLLRLKSMGDLVFAGAAGRAAAGVTEVKLVLRSDDERWVGSDGRLEIARRVYRSGPSEYRLNGRPARLRDVADELFAVGLGTRGYAIIEQGRVGQVLSARPTDRRALLEEAAGITHYKVRRRESELKLEHTRQNLLRLEDVVAEVDRSLRQLKRQAKQAERHQKLGDDLKDALRRLLTGEAHRVDAARADAGRARAQRQNEVAAGASALGGAEADLAQARAELDRGRTDLEAVRSEVATLVGSRERLEAFLERSADLVDTLRANLQRGRQDETALRSRAAELERQWQEADARSTSRQGELDVVTARVVEVAAKKAACRADLEQAEGRAAQQRQELLRTISSLTDARNRLAAVVRDQDRLTYAVSQADQEVARLDGRRADTGERLAAASGARTQAAAVAESLAETRRAEEEVRARTAADVAEAKRAAEAHGHIAWELRHRLAGLDRELASHAAALDQVAAFLPADAVDGQVSDHLAPAADVIPWLDRVWGALLEMPVVRQTSLSPDQRRQAEAQDGSVRLALAGPGAEPSPPPDLPGCRNLTAAAGMAEAERGWLEHCLPPAYLSPDRERARELAEAYPGVVVLDPDGVVWRGRTMEPATAGTRLRGALALRAERDKVTVELDAAVAGRDQAVVRQGELERALTDSETRLAEVDRRRVAAEQERARCEAVELAVAGELSRLERELEAMHRDSERNRELGTDMGRRRARLEHETAEHQEHAHQLERAVEEMAAALERRREAAREALRAVDRVKAEQRLAAERRGGARAEAQRLEREQRDAGKRVEGLAADIVRHGQELDQTEREVVQSRTRLAEEHGLLTAARERERDLAERVTRSGNRVTALDVEVKRRRELHDQARDALHQAEVDRTRVDAEWDRLRDQVAAELTEPPELLLASAPPTDVNLDELRAVVAALRAQIDQLGPVNLLALKEVEELEQRSVFLHEQRRDLVTSLKSLDATIHEIDGECTSRFVATFETVNQLFGETFSRLFGGGSARLDLVDEDDPLESGIDITAQPPGKRNQSVQLLSGGEKALTALSLLISLFRIKPSPFCVLDEVDAPLDDANVERLAELIRSMADHTQFVLVTHNRRTMARADVLYGVTMEEAGVSKIVSVRLEE